MYADKNYSAEVLYVLGLIERLGLKRPSRVLDFGCGTGLHAQHFNSVGCTVHGVDMSGAMIDVARQRKYDAVNSSTFEVGDIRTYRDSFKYEVVTSLFHVMSYQSSHGDFRLALKTVRSHLHPGGLFIFDFWYGPAVLWQRPGCRVKRLSNELIDVCRFAEPNLRDIDNIVDVDYTVYIRNLVSGNVETLRESHRMRYFFLPEVIDCLNQAGFKFIKAEEWMSGALPSINTWGVCVVAVAC